MLKYSSNIRSFVCEKKYGPCWELVASMLVRYPQIEVLLTYCCNRMFYIDFAKFYGDKYQDINLCILQGYAAGMKQNIISGSSGLKSIVVTSDKQYLNLLKSKLTKVEYLMTGSKINNEIMNTIYECKKLKKLCIISLEESCVIDMIKLLSLENIEDLHIYVTYKSNIEISSFEGIHFSRVMKLEMRCESNLQNFHLHTIWNICPNLQHFKLLSHHLNDQAFEGIHKCKYMKYIDVSSCNPGFYNGFLRFISEGCPYLEFLDVSNSPKKIRYDIRILENCKHLKYLLMENQIIIDEHLALIPNLFPNLIEIRLFRCQNLSQELLNRLKRKMLNLQITTHL